MSICAYIYISIFASVFISIYLISINLYLCLYLYIYLYLHIYTYVFLATCCVPFWDLLGLLPGPQNYEEKQAKPFNTKSPLFQLLSAGVRYDVMEDECGRHM